MDHFDWSYLQDMIDDYRSLLKDYYAFPIEPKRFEIKSIKPAWSDAVPHLLWMLDQLENDPKFMEQPDKAMRWVCFIQGVMWMKGMMSVDEFRADNYQAINGEPSPA